MRRLVALTLHLALPCLLAWAPLTARAEAPDPGYAQVTLTPDNTDRPKRSGRGFGRFSSLSPKGLALGLAVGGGALAYLTAPEGFTIIEENGTSPVTVGVTMALSFFLPTLLITEVMEPDDDCLGGLLTIPILGISYVLTVMILDATERGANAGNVVFPLASGALGVGLGMLIASAAGELDARAGPGLDWSFGAGPTEGGVQLGAARRF